MLPKTLPVQQSWIARGRPILRRSHVIPLIRFGKLASPGTLQGLPLSVGPMQPGVPLRPPLFDEPRQVRLVEKVPGKDRRLTPIASADSIPKPLKRLQGIFTGVTIRLPIGGLALPVVRAGQDQTDVIRPGDSNEYIQLRKSLFFDPFRSRLKTSRRQKNAGTIDTHLAHDMKMFADFLSVKPAPQFWRPPRMWIVVVRTERDIRTSRTTLLEVTAPRCNHDQFHRRSICPLGSNTTRDKQKWRGDKNRYPRTSRSSSH